LFTSAVAAAILVSLFASSSTIEALSPTSPILDHSWEGGPPAVRPPTNEPTQLTPAPTTTLPVSGELIGVCGAFAKGSEDQSAEACCSWSGEWGMSSGWCVFRNGRCEPNTKQTKACPLTTDPTQLPTPRPTSPGPTEEPTSGNCVKGDYRVDPKLPCIYHVCSGGGWVKSHIDCPNNLGVPCKDGEWVFEQGKCCPRCEVRPTVQPTPTPTPRPTSPGPTEEPTFQPTPTPRPTSPGPTMYIDCPKDLGEPCEGGEWVYKQGKYCPTCEVRPTVQPTPTPTPRPTSPGPTEEPTFQPTLKIKCRDGKRERVCGKDGKTYKNACKAKKKNVEVDYRGICKVKVGWCENSKRQKCRMRCATPVCPKKKNRTFCAKRRNSCCEYKCKGSKRNQN